MTIHTNYTQARANLAKFLDRVSQDREVVIIQRRGEEDVAMISAEELSGLIETAYLLRSPKNADRLFTSLARALRNEGEVQSIKDLRYEVGIEQ